MEHGRLAPLGIGVEGGSLHKRVRVSAKDGVDARSGHHQLLVAHGFGIDTADAQMRQADDGVAMFLVTKEVGHLLRHGDGVFVNHALTLVGLYQSFGLGSQAEKADAQAVAFDDHIGLHQPLERRTCHVVVGADHRKASHAEEAGHVLHAEVELMVADGHGVVAHVVHQLDFDLALVEVVVGRALRDVATIEHERVGMFGTELANEGGTAGQSTLTGIGVGGIGGQGFHTAVHVARLEQIEFFCLLGGEAQRQASGQPKQHIDSFHHCDNPFFLEFTLFISSSPHGLRCAPLSSARQPSRAPRSP